MLEIIDDLFELYREKKRLNGITFIIYLILFALGPIVTSKAEFDDPKAVYWLDQLDEEDNLGEASSADTSEAHHLVCPSNNVIRTRYKCRSSSSSATSSTWIDCTRSQCCPGYNFIGGKCLEDSIDPCALGLCEQGCTILNQRLVCSCWQGYRYSPERHKNGEKSVCIEVNECEEGTSGCDQICQNLPVGSFTCGCNDGFQLRSDNKSCERNKSEKSQRARDFGTGKSRQKFSEGLDSDMIFENGPTGGNTKCYATCDSLSDLESKMRIVQEELADLRQLKRANSRKNPPRPAAGFQGSGGFSDDDVSSASEAYLHVGEEKNSILNSYVKTEGGYCKCQRGPIGPEGPQGKIGPKGDTGERGPRGPKGSTGSFDFLLLLLADVRHDLVVLQDKVFQGEPLPKFDFENALKNQRLSTFEETRATERKSEINKRKHSQHSVDTQLFEDGFYASETIKYYDYPAVSEDSSAIESSGDDWELYED